MAKKSQNRGGWLFKEEPATYNYATLEKDGSTLWAGVKNPLARQHLRNVKAGDRVLYYHTGTERAIVGEMRAVADAAADPAGVDPKSVVVKVAPVRRWKSPVTLEQIKQDPFFEGWELVRMSRLSIMPVSHEQWKRLEEIGRKNAAGTD